MLSGCRKPRQVAVFISGGGSTLQSLLEVQHEFNIKLIICNRKKALGALKAKRFGCSVEYVNKETSFEQIDQLLKKHNINFIFLAGYMKILPEVFVNNWAGRMVNIHPSLLPSYKGLEAAERSWADNYKMGVTLHYVTSEMDKGEIIDQRVSLSQPQQISIEESMIFLRRTEQSILRDFANRYNL